MVLVGVGRINENAIKLEDEEARTNAACNVVAARSVKWRLDWKCGRRKFMVLGLSSA